MWFPVVASFGHSLDGLAGHGCFAIQLRQKHLLQIPMPALLFGLASAAIATSLNDYLRLRRMQTKLPLASSEWLRRTQVPRESITLFFRPRSSQILLNRILILVSTSSMSPSQR
jgi:hypothetical protein